jgi:hypothetical protein
MKLVLTFNRAIPAGQLRETQYKALFTVTRDEHRTCRRCRRRAHAEHLDDLGIRIAPLQSGPDTIEAAIRRSMRDTLNRITPASCGCKDVDVTVERKIIAAPEYLCICLETFYVDGEGKARKNRNPIRIPDILDITEHMNYDTQHPIPVRYRLTSGAYHIGATLESGHYVSGVTTEWGQRPGTRRKNGPVLPTRPQFLCNDEEISDFPGPAGTNRLRSGRAFHGSPYVLWYVRTKETSVPAPSARPEDSIGGRLKLRRERRRA